MNNPLRATLVVAAVTSGAACSDTVTGRPATPDAATPMDVRADAPPGSDGSPSTDLPAQPDANAPDANAPDATAPDDAGPSIEGRWRVVGWDYTNPRGETTRLTDRDTPIRDPMSGMTTPFRVNGIFFLRASRLSWSFGTVGAQHFYAYAPTNAMDDGYSASGTTVPGLLDNAAATFTVPGGMTVFRFSRNPDGTLTFEYSGGSERSVTTLARAPSSPTLANLNVAGVAQIRTPARSQPMQRPRFALLWDRPMGAAFVESHGSALTFNGAYARYFVVQAGAPPAEAQGRAYGVPIALAFTLVYDDVNGNGRFDPAADGGAGDVSRGLGPLAVAWRGEGAPNAEFESSPLSDLQPGYQIAHLHRDFGSGGFTVVPFDTTVPVNPDTPVLEEPLRGAVPRLVR